MYSSRWLLDKDFFWLLDKDFALDLEFSSLPLGRNCQATQALFYAVVKQIKLFSESENWGDSQFTQAVDGFIVLMYFFRERPTHGTCLCLLLALSCFRLWGMLQNMQVLLCLPWRTSLWVLEKQKSFLTCVYSADLPDFFYRISHWELQSDRPHRYRCLL